MEGVEMAVECRRGRLLRVSSSLRGREAGVVWRVEVEVEVEVGQANKFGRHGKKYCTAGADRSLETSS